MRAHVHRKDGKSYCGLEAGRVRMLLSTRYDWEDKDICRNCYWVADCMTRQSYASSDGARLVETFASAIDDGTHTALLRDLSDWEAKGDACMHASFEVMPPWWKQALEALRKTKR